MTGEQKLEVECPRCGIVLEMYMKEVPRGKLKWTILKVVLVGGMLALLLLGVPRLAEMVG